MSGKDEKRGRVEHLMITGVTRVHESDEAIESVARQKGTQNVLLRLLAKVVEMAIVSHKRKK